MANAQALLRAQLINFEVFDSSGKRRLGVADIELPELKFLTAEISGAGVSGKLDFPTLGMTDSLELSLNWRSLNSDLIDFSMQKSTDLTLYGASQIYNHGEGKLGVEQIKISFRGISKTTALGNFKPAEGTESKNTFEILYLKIDIGGKNVLELDKINMIMKINGTDYLAETRKALGLN